MIALLKVGDPLCPDCAGSPGMMLDRGYTESALPKLCKLCNRDTYFVYRGGGGPPAHDPKQEAPVKRSVYHRDIPVTEEDLKRGHITIDLYFLVDLFGVTDHAIAHAIKKLLVPGQRGGKTKEQDLGEAVWSINRYLEIQARKKGSGG